MEMPSGRPWADNADTQGEPLLQPQSDSHHPNIVPVSNPPPLSNSSLQSPRGRPPLSSRSTTVTGKKHVPGNKVAIPRQRTGTAPRYSRRVPLACETCRLRKTKCSGDTPICRQCAELRVECRYPVSWRERTKGQLAKLSAKSADYENLLREIRSFVDGCTSERIKEILGKYSEHGDGPLNDQQSTNSISVLDEEPDPDGQSLPSSIGSLDAIDRVDEDLNRNPLSRATGYMGKNSEVTWLQRLQREAENRARKMSETKPDFEFPIHSVNYHLDDMDITPSGPVQLYWIPPRNVADKLFEDYLESIHPIFPIISRSLFTAQYRNFFDHRARPGDKWLAILNLIFAIASHHAHLMQAPWRGDERDHLIYLARARALSMNSDTLFTHPDLQQVQVEALTAFYLLSTDQINRAWRIASLALRSGISLGLNLRNTSEITADVSKEARYRVWWCLYTFEHLLGIMTGRMTGISDGICTTPMPLPADEDRFQDPAVAELLGSLDLRQDRVESALASSFVRQMPLSPRNGKDMHDTDKIRDSSRLKNLAPCTSLFFLYYVDLAVIVQEIVNRVYSLDCITVPWADIENRIVELRSRIELWYSNLHEAYDFDRNNDQNPDMLRFKLCLAFHFYGARIMLGRPCLCRRDTRQNPISHQPKVFSHELAVDALESALRLIALIPDEPDAARIYQLCPWWCVLHYLMQATTVLLLELSFGSVHMPEEEKSFLTVTKKALRWLYAMSKNSLASQRAWELCDGNFRRLATELKLDVSNIPAADYQRESDSITQHPHHLQANPNPPSATQPHPSTLPAPIFDSPFPSGADGQQEQQHPLSTLQQSHSPHPVPAAAAHLQPPQTEDLFLLPIDSSAANNMYFPYDPITGEFIRSFFPTSNEEETWDGQS